MFPSSIPCVWRCRLGLVGKGPHATPLWRGAALFADLDHSTPQTQELRWHHLDRRQSCSLSHWDRTQSQPSPLGLNKTAPVPIWTEECWSLFYFLLGQNKATSFCTRREQTCSLPHQPSQASSQVGDVDWAWSAKH